MPKANDLVSKTQDIFNYLSEMINQTTPEMISNKETNHKILYRGLKLLIFFFSTYTLALANQMESEADSSKDDSTVGIKYLKIAIKSTISYLLNTISEMINRSFAL